MLVRIVRVLTALAVVGACALLMSRGWDIVRFSMADSLVNEARGPSADQVDAVRPWRDVSGLRFAAQASFLTVVRDPDAGIRARKRRDELMDVLSIKPLSSKHWLLLSEIQLVTGARNQIENALRLSVLTGPNEGFTMGRRGLFGLSQWELLPAELQKRAAADLVANPEPLSNSQRTWLRQELSEKKEAVRQDIRSVLLAQGFSEKGLAEIGL